LVNRATAALADIDEAKSITTTSMSLANGLEFRAVVVMACDESVLPLDERVADAADEAELDDIFETERLLPHVSCASAREHLLLTALAPGSEYFADLGGT
jgi:superfamily I DNA/RNA helicase